MGDFKSSENSLNQHIKLKHPELWSKFKNPELAVSEMLNERKNNGHDEKDIKF